MVKIVFPDPPPIPVRDSLVLTQLVKMSFAGRRKTLWNNLRNSRILGLSAEEISKSAKKAGIDLSLRAESVPPKDFARFADVLAG
jgi:16S rRNA (adenine1518-N6/adenine1519-N6)-dimethyltransferase